MKLVKSLLVFGCVLSLIRVGSPAQSLSVEVVIDPAATFLLVTNDPAPDATPIDLGALGIHPGDFILLSEMGQWNNGANRFLTSMIGVFSSNSVLLASNQLNRVPGAIGIGSTVDTPPTFFGNIPTAIPQVFAIPTTNTSVRVPPGAGYLFASADDSFYGDNFQNSTNPFSLQIATTATGVETILTVTLSPSNTLSVSWNSTTNQWYQLQATTSFLDTWTNVGDPILGTGFPMQQTGLPMSGANLFYRMAQSP